MKLQTLLDEIQDHDPDDEVVVVQQPAYPLMADINEIEWRDGKIYIFLHDAHDYYSNEPDEEEDEDE